MIQKRPSEPQTDIFNFTYITLLKTIVCEGLPVGRGWNHVPVVFRRMLQ
jgi:hypothetical protein